MSHDSIKTKHVPVFSLFMWTRQIGRYRQKQPKYDKMKAHTILLSLYIKSSKRRSKRYYDNPDVSTSFTGKKFGVGQN